MPTASAIRRAPFFASVRPMFGTLSAVQVDGMSRILDEAERRGLGDLRILAYRFATAFHETGKAMVPVREGGEAYLSKKAYYPWVGEGLVQVTWETNARKFGASRPGDCMSWPVALRALFDGMDLGIFTGRKVGAYFTATIDDPVGARHVINGADKAALIATYHGQFLMALRAATHSEMELVAAAPVAPGFWASLARAFGLAASKPIGWGLHQSERPSHVGGLFAFRGLGGSPFPGLLGAAREPLIMSKGQVAGLISGAVTILTAFGLTDVASIVQNPIVGFAITTAVGAIGSAIAGHLPGKKAA